MQSIKQRHLRENILLNGIRVLLNLLIPLVIFKRISGILGPDKLGQVEYANSIISYFILFSSLGIPVYGLREIAKCRNNIIERSEVVFELSMLLFILVCVNYVIYFFLLNVIGLFKGDYLLYLVLAPNIFFLVFNFEWFYQGIEEQRYITFRYLFVKIIQLGLVFFFVRTNKDYIKYALILFGLNGISSVFNIVHLKKFIVSITKLSINIKRQLRFIVVLSSSSLVTSISSQFDVTMLGSLSGNVYVGYYIAGTKAVRLFLNLFTAIFFVLIPRIEYYKMNNDIEKYNELVKSASSGILILIIPIGMGIFRFSESIILFLAGDQFQPSVLLLKITSCFIFVDMMSFILVWFFMFPNRGENKFAICLLIAALVNIGLNIVMIPFFAHIGAMVATIISTIVGFVMQLFFSRKYFKISFLFNKETLKYFVAGLIMLIVLFLMPFNFNVHLLNLLVGMCIGASIYVILLILLKSIIFLSMMNKIKNMITSGI
jgi:O-antigen/teichoic acid export membrane protein